MKMINAFYIDGKNFYAEETPDIPVYSPFGHLGEKYIFIMYRLHYLNDTISELYTMVNEYQERRKNHEYEDDIGHKITHRTFRFSTELKIILDEMIMLFYVLDYHKNENEYPNKIEIDSIGALLNADQKLNSAPFKNHMELMSDINNIANAIKHSFINSEVNWLRPKTIEPIISAYYHPRNDFSKNKFNSFHIKLSDLVDRLNSFLNDYRNYLMDCFSEG